MPSCNLVGKIKIRLVLLNRTTERHAGLHSRVSRVGHRAERIYRLEIPVSQITVDVSVKIVRSRTGDDVHHSTGGAAILRGIIVGNDLKFLHRLLRHGRAHAVGRIVRGIGSIDIYQV